MKAHTTAHMTAVVIAAFIPLVAAAQTSADSTRLVFVVEAVRNRVFTETGRQPEQRTALKYDKVAGAVVALQSGLVLGTSDDSGSAVATNVPLGRQQLTIRAKDYQPLSCRVNIRGIEGDTVRIQLIPERKVLAWETAPACRTRR